MQQRTKRSDNANRTNPKTVDANTYMKAEKKQDITDANTVFLSFPTSFRWPPNVKPIDANDDRHVSASPESRECTK